MDGDRRISGIGLVAIALCATFTSLAVLASKAPAAAHRHHSAKVGAAPDGIPIYGPLGVKGKKVRWSDLDSCGGHTHKIKVHGHMVRRYHYHLVKGSKRRPGCAPAVRFGTSAGLFPEFDPAVSDYVVRCDGGSLGVDVSGKGDEYVSVDNQPGRRGDLHVSVPLAHGQAFSIRSLIGGETKTYNVRCLPADFPKWDWQRFAEPRRDFYAVTPTGSLQAAQPPYAILFDRNGVPVWWYRAESGFPADAKVLANGNIAWARSDYTGYEVRGVDGGLRRVVSVPGSLTDAHDLQDAGNGSLMLAEFKPRTHVDLSAYGGTDDETVADAVLRDYDAAGNLIWSWDSKDHIGLEETGRWWPTALTISDVVDPVHFNSLDVYGSTVVASFRHTDAVYAIDIATGKILWKLGGTPTPQSLTVVGDPYGAWPLGGQHDARMHADGTLTLHDNGTNLGRPPRAARYAIDPVNRTATLVEQVTDPEISSSFCCGSARRSDDGSWVMSWGGNSFATEFTADHKRTFKLGWGGPFSYRAFPVPDGRLSATALRTGMNAMHPR